MRSPSTDGSRDPALLQAIIDGTTDAVFVKDRDGRYALVNLAAARMSGRTPEEIEGKHDHDLFPAEQANAMREDDRRILDAEVPVLTFEERLQVQGDTRTFLTTKVPHRAPDGRIVGVIGIARDVTDRVRAQEALKDSERLLRVVVDALPLGVSVVDAAGNLVLINRASEAIWGASITDGAERWKRSRGYWHATHEPVKPDEWASVRALFDGVPELDQLIDIEAFDGRQRTIRNSAVPVVRPTGIRGAVIVNEDVTERLRLEARLSQAAKMEAVGQLAGGVAHDFNNLLTVISSYTDTLTESLAGDDPRRADLAEIRKAAESAATLTRQLLAFSRGEKVQPRDVVLETAVAAAERMLARLLPENVRVVLELAEPPNVVRIDPAQLEQILVNLAVNARDAMPNGGVLTIATKTVERSEQDVRATALPRAGRYALLEVRDTGTGIDERTRARIFEPFFTTKERGRGTGLGLSTVYAIVSRSGGSIRVESAEGKGTTFCIELPLAADAASDERPSVLPGAVGSETVLLVDSSAPVRLAVRAMLERRGYRVHDEADGAAALAWMDQGGAPDLLLADVMLPGMSGRDLARAAGERREGLRVLLMSDGPDDETLRAEPTPLRKPFSVAGLARAVRDALDGT